jgi:hypothetical protein
VDDAGSDRILLRRRPRLLGPVVVTTAFYAGLLLTYVLIYRGEVSSLVCAAQERIGQGPLEAVRVGFPAHGFDGQFYYIVAQDPWRRHGEFIDCPVVRHARILYPALAWLVSGGDPERLLWALPGINLAAFAGLGLLGAVTASHFGRSPWWGVLLTFALNVGVAGLRDLTDPVSTLAACGLVVGWLLGWRSWHLALWAVAAVLSREQNVILPAILLLDALLLRRWGSGAAFAAAVLTWLAWICLLRGVYGAWPFVAENTTAPFMGIIQRLAHISGRFHTPSSPIHAVGMALVLLQLALSGYVLYSRPGRVVALVCLSGAALAVLGGMGIYTILETYTRVFWWMPLGVWLWSMQSGRRWPVLVLSLAVLLPLAALWQARNTERAGRAAFASQRPQRNSSHSTRASASSIPATHSAVRSPSLDHCVPGNDGCRSPFCRASRASRCGPVFSSSRRARASARCTCCSSLLRAYSSSA